MNKTDVPNFRFKNLDSIRTIAFLSTFMAHAFYSDSSEILDSKAFQMMIKFSQVFSFGVPIFFVLSGFLISYLMLKEQESNDKFSIGKFYVRRILRIWPVYYLVILVGVFVFPLIRHHVLHLPYIETANLYYYLTFLSNFDQINAAALPFGVGLGPTWSVSVEEQFYLFWPLLLLIFKRSKFIIAILLTLAVSIIFTFSFHLNSKNTIYCLTYLSIGGLYGYLAIYKKDLVQRLVNIKSYLFFAVIILLFLLMTIYANWYGNFFIIISISLLIGYIIIFQCYANKNELRKIPYLERIGKYTYGLYLYHVICNFIIFTAFDKLLKTNDTIFLSIVVKPIFSLILSLILSYLSYHYFERKFLTLKSKFRTV